MSDACKFTYTPTLSHCITSLLLVVLNILLFPLIFCASVFLLRCFGSSVLASHCFLCSSNVCFSLLCTFSVLFFIRFLSSACTPDSFSFCPLPKNISLFSVHTTLILSISFLVLSPRRPLPTIWSLLRRNHGAESPAL